MGEIRKDNLHESLIEELNELANIDLSGKQDKTDESLLTESKDVIGAINELFQSANNGKELIANAIGEPLDASDTFSAMSNDINSLLSTFKTNMMNNGITVESSDKFKQLIDKIATMVEEGSGKGIQFAEGNLYETTLSSYGTVKYSETFSTNLDFIPTLIFIGPVTVMGRNYDYSEQVNKLYISNLNSTYVRSTTEQYVEIINISENSFTINFWAANNSSYYGRVYLTNDTKYYAIGIGEEDTTLRDSLADILENKGVDITEEDDMASLITKVDNIGGGLDIISATELPATGRENQICVITDNPVDNFVITSNYSDINTNNTIYIFLGNSLDTTGIKGTNFDLVSNNITVKYYLLSVHQGDNKLDSYIYKNNQWTNATMSSVYIVEKGNSVNESYTGGFNGDWIVGNLNGTPCYVANIPNNASAGGGTMCFDNSTVNKINLSDYTTLECTVASSMPEYSYGGYLYMFINTTRSITIYVDQLYKYWAISQPGSFTTYTIDISGITGEFYLGIAYIGRGYGHKLCVSDIRLY